MTNSDPERGEVAVTAAATTAPGRFIVSARANHLVSDSRLTGGEAIHAGELLLAALASCALANIENRAAESGFGVVGVTATASHTRGVEDPTRYARTLLEIGIGALDDSRGWALVDNFVATCPIYNTVRRGSGIEITLNGRRRPASPGAGDQGTR
ncbi:OsmC family protein [Nocardia sp. NBC_00416]|uniref:OsmC family protein n=1 Tax=Nocardia sp. NBC_00416 TaxID=2975991 RepID=UPI002E1B1605